MSVYGGKERVNSKTFFVTSFYSHPQMVFADSADRSAYFILHFNDTAVFLTLFQTTEFWTCPNGKEMAHFVLDGAEKMAGKGKCWFPAFSPLLTSFWEGLSPRVKIG